MKLKLMRVNTFHKGNVYIANEDFRFEAFPLPPDEGKKGEKFIFTGERSLGFARFKTKKWRKRRVISIDVKEALRIFREEVHVYGSFLSR